MLAADTSGMGCIGTSAAGKPEENLFEIHDSTTADSNAFFLEKLDFLPDSSAFSLALESTHPTGCGHHPVSRYLGRIGIVLHGLADPTVGPGAERMRNFLVGRDTPAGHLPQKIVCSVSKSFHRFPLSALGRSIQNGIFVATRKKRCVPVVPVRTILV